MHALSWPLEITINGHPPSANELRRLHPLARYRRCKPFKEHVAWQCKALHLPAPLQRARVVATLTYTRRLFRDPDSAAASLKPCLDGLVVGGLVVDDSPAHFTLEVRQEVGQERAVRLEVWPREDACGNGPAHADDDRKDGKYAGDEDGVEGACPVRRPHARPARSGASCRT
jgi:hypothetical protein